MQGHYKYGRYIWANTNRSKRSYLGIIFSLVHYILLFLHITFKNTKQPYLQKKGKSTILLLSVVNTCVSECVWVFRTWKALLYSTGPHLTTSLCSLQIYLQLVELNSIKKITLVANVTFTLLVFKLRQNIVLHQFFTIKRQWNQCSVPVKHSGMSFLGSLRIKTMKNCVLFVKNLSPENYRV